MSQLIEYQSEPKRLLLTWEPPLGVKGRTRWIVGELALNGQIAEFRYLVDDEFTLANNGRPEAELRASGYFGYPAFDSRAASFPVFREHVLEAFLRRLPPPSRSDYGSYLAHFRIPPHAELSPLSLLGATEARLPGDGFCLIDPLDPGQSFCDVVLEVAGHRHYPQSREGLKGREGASLQLVSEPDHAHDTHAVRVEIDGAVIGYVNRVQSPTISQWLVTRDVQASLLRLNGSSQKPRAFIFVSVRPGAEQKAA